MRKRREESFKPSHIDVESLFHILLSQLLHLLLNSLREESHIVQVFGCLLRTGLMRVAYLKSEVVLVLEVLNYYSSRSTPFEVLISILIKAWECAFKVFVKLLLRSFG